MIRVEPLAPVAYEHLGALVRDALLQFKTEVALIETRRKRVLRTMSYSDVFTAAQAMAASLSAAGIGPGDRVAIVMSNQPSWLIAASGALFIGATLVPLDYKLTAEEQASLIEHAGPKAIITEYSLWRRSATDKSGVLGSAIDGCYVCVTEAPETADLPGAVRLEQALIDGADLPTPPMAQRSRDDIACIVYSSGTGGRPKGCLLSHGNYLSQLESLLTLFPMTVGDRYFSILPTNHAIDFMCGFVGALSSGATIVHQRTLRPEFIVATMKRERITHMAIVPLILEAFERRLDESLADTSPVKSAIFKGLTTLNQLVTERRSRRWLSKRLLAPVHKAFGGELKVLFCGGAFVDRKRAERFYNLGLPVVIGYGLTDCCTVATVNTLTPFRADSVGSAVPGVELRIDAPNDRGVGEVWVKGPTVMKGYLDAPELTAETLTPNGWLKTGDLGWLDASHHLHLVGRAKNMIVTAGGKNIYPEDIEGAFDGLPCEEMAIFAANYIWPKAALTGETLVAVVRPEANLGDGDGGSQDQGAIALGELLTKLREKNRSLADFKRIHGVVTWSEAFPRTASMKIKRVALAGELRQRLDEDAITPLYPTP